MTRILDYFEAVEYRERTAQDVVNVMTNYERTRWARVGYPGAGEPDKITAHLEFQRILNAAARKMR